MASLYLFPTLLADIDFNQVLPAENIKKILSAKFFIVEEIRSARRFLRKIGYTDSFDEVSFSILNEHTKDEDIADFLSPIAMGNDVFLLSEAGLPCVADPGSKAVAIAQKRNTDIIPLVGPSCIYMSLMASGFNGQNFTFLGYLPAKTDDRESKLRKIEQRCYKENQTQIFIEAPYRNDKLFASLIKILSEETLLCIATDITSPAQKIKTKSIRQWKKEKDFQIGKKNTVFLIYRP